MINNFGSSQDGSRLFVTLNQAHEKAASPRGAFHTPSRIDEARPTIEGQGVAGSQVTLYAGQSAIGVAIVDSQGFWSHVPQQPLAPGQHAISATVGKGATLVRSEVWSIKVGAAPEQAPVGDSEGQGSAAVVGAVAVEAAQQQAQSSPAPVTVAQELVATTTPETFVVSEAEVAGNGTNTVAQASYMGPPVIDTFYDNVGTQTGHFKSGDATDDTTPTLWGRATPGSMVMVMYEGHQTLGAARADDQGVWSFTPQVGEGTHNFVAMVNGVRSESFVITVGEPVFSDSAEPDTLVELHYSNNTPIDSAQANRSGAGSFTPDQPLSEGAHEFFVEAHVGPGSQTSQSFHFTVDTAGFSLGNSFMIEELQLTSFEGLNSLSAPTLQDGNDLAGFSIPSGISLDAVLSGTSMELFSTEPAPALEGEVLLEMPMSVMGDITHTGIEMAAYDVVGNYSLVREEYVVPGM